MIRKLLRPKVIIPTLVSIGLLAGLISLGDPRLVLRSAAKLHALQLLWFLCAVIVYEVVRCLQWCFLLRAQTVRAPIKAQVLSFLLGELAKNLPFGNYVQSYILYQYAQAARGQQASFSRTAAASTVIIGLEIAVCAAVLLVAGLGKWSLAVRLCIVIALAVVGFFGWLGYEVRYYARLPSKARHWPLLQRFTHELRQFVNGARGIMHIRVLLAASMCSVLYIATAAAALDIVAASILTAHAGFGRILGVYCFSLALSLLFPLPSDLGVAEVSGTGALVLLGVRASLAVRTMLLFRALILLAALVILLASLPFLTRELSVTLHGLDPSASSP